MLKTEHPVVELKSGLRVANFSSAHPFTFDTGEVLPACSEEVCRYLSLEPVEFESPNPKGFMDIRLWFLMHMPVYDALLALAEDEGVDVILVPLPVLTALKEERCVWMEGVPDNLEKILSKARVQRAADRVTKTIRSDRFCI